MASTTYDPDLELAKKIASGQISGEAAQQEIAKLVKPNTANAPPIYNNNMLGNIYNGVTNPAMRDLLTGNTNGSTVPAPVTPPTQSVPTGLIGLRDAATQRGLQVGWDKANGVTINGMPVNVGGLTNYQGNAPQGYQNNTYYGTQDQINGILGQFTYQNPYSAQEQAALEDYQKWASQPYVSQYAPQIETLVKQILARQFQYDPKNDAQFQLASKELTRNVMEAMNSRGILNSSMTVDNVTQGVADLMPQYQQLAFNQFQSEGDRLMSQVDMLTGLDNTAYGRYQDEGQRLAGALDIVMKMSDNQYKQWSDAYTRRYNTYRDSITDAQNKVEAERKKIADAWDRVSELGYVDNGSSIILGVPAGTLSKEAREAKEEKEARKEEQKQALKDRLAEIEAQYQKEKKLAEIKQTATSGPESLGDEKQVSNYYQLRDIYFGGGEGTYKDNPLKAYNWLISHSKDNISMMGDKLYNKLLAELMDSMKVNKTYTEKTNTNETFTIDDWKVALDNEFIPKYNSNGDILNNPVTNTMAREKRILSLNLDDNMTMELYKRYGIPLPQ